MGAVGALQSATLLDGCFLLANLLPAGRAGPALHSVPSVPRSLFHRGVRLIIARYHPSNLIVTGSAYPAGPSTGRRGTNFFCACGDMARILGFVIGRPPMPFAGVCGLEGLTLWCYGMGLSLRRMLYVRDSF